MPEQPESAVATKRVDKAILSAARMGKPSLPSVMRLTQAGIAVSEYSS
jgi:hypothetical protein